MSVDIEAIDDCHLVGEIPISPALDGMQPRDYQESMFRKSILAGRGVIDISTGGGKTFLAAMIMKWYLNRYPGIKCVFMVNNVRLLDQAWTSFKDRGLDVGMFGGGHNQINHDITVAMIQSLSRDNGRMDCISNAGVLIFDEAHHVPARSWIDVALGIKAKYRFGMSATAFEDSDGQTVEDYLLVGLTGPILGRVPSWVLREKGVLASPEVRIIPVTTKVFHVGNNWQKIYRKAVIDHKERNQLVVQASEREAVAGKSVLIFVSQISHGISLMTDLQKTGVNVIFCKGGEEVFTSPNWSDHWPLSKVSDWMSQAGSVTLATPAFDEGVDVSAVNCIVLACAGKKHRRLIQRIGRGLRVKQNSTFGNACWIYDFSDEHHPIMRHHAKQRVSTYLSERIPICHFPLR
jgi:superfamily II DNA or RNA helicase